MEGGVKGERRGRREKDKEKRKGRRKRREERYMMLTSLCCLTNALLSLSSLGETQGSSWTVHPHHLPGSHRNRHVPG